MIDSVLVVNAGSSSLKLSIVGTESEAPVAGTTVEAWDGEDVDAIAEVTRGHRVDAVGHRVVHGGVRFSGPIELDDANRVEIAALAPLAPLHQPRALAAIKGVTRVLGDVPGFACFDTAFHASLPAAAATYGIPEAWRIRWGIRRFGFHGLSHQWASRRAARLMRRPVEGLAIVTCHLGAGASLCAVDRGVSVDTTMGFTPLEGLVMATRSGSVDPGLVIWLLRQGLSVDEVSDGLELHGGLLALAGTADMRELLRAAESDVTAASAALDVYIHRICREIGAMTASLGRIDALVFTAGVGEHAPTVRAAVAERLAYLGVCVDPALNAACSGDKDLSSHGASVATLVVTAREDLEIARQVRMISDHE